MENWKKIQSFSRAYKADLRKEILKNNNIAAVVLAAQDSAFLIGDFELFVEQQNVEAAGIILEEFKGWTKVNSFSVLQSVKIVEEYLIEAQIEIFFTRNMQLNEYEIYVKNEDSEKAFKVVETVKPWVLLGTFKTPNQAAYRAEQLTKYDINTIAIKRRTPDKQFLNLDLLVNTNNYNLATQIIQEMVGWHFIYKYEDRTKALLTQNMLEKEDIEVVVKETVSSDDKYKTVELFVEYKNIELSQKLIDKNKEWVAFGAYKKLYQVEMLREILKQNNICSVFINEKGSMFLFGEMRVYVEKADLEKAKEYIKSWKDALDRD